MSWWTLRRLRSRNPRRRARAAAKLGQFRDAWAVMPLVAALGDEHDSVQRAAAEALGEMADERTIKLLVILLKDEHAWWAAMDALVRLGSPAVEPLVVALKDGDAAARGRAAQALGRIGDARAAGPLSAALEDMSWFVRQAAAEAFGRIGSAQAVGLLLSPIADEEVAETAVSALRLVLETAAPQIEPANLGSGACEPLKLRACHDA